MPNARLVAVKILNKFYNNSLKLEEVVSDFMSKSSFFSQLDAKQYVTADVPQEKVNSLAAAMPSIDKNLVLEITFGVVRWQIWLDFILQNYIDMQKTRMAVINILRIAFYQILFLDRVPNYACCNEAVEIVKAIYMNNAEPLSRLVSGVLHAFLKDIKQNRDFMPRTDDIIYNFEKIYSHPGWLVKRLVAQYGIPRTEKILSSNNIRPKLTIRINSNKNTNSQVIEELSANNINIFLNLAKTNNIIVDAKIDTIQKLSLWKNGSICIQDVSATLCALLCAPQAGNIIFDLCSAPGGKTMLLSELLAKQQANGKIICNDIDIKRLEKCNENIERMRYDNIHLTNYDVLQFDYPEKADIVLLDAPCSGIGAIRKNVDIKYLKDETQLQNNISLQRKMLAKVSSLLNDGGHLIYSICSIDKEEGEENIKWLLNNDSRYELEDAKDFIGAEWTEGNYLLTTTMLGEGIADGAFAARLKFKHC